MLVLMVVMFVLMVVMLMLMMMVVVVFFLLVRLLCLFRVALATRLQLRKLRLVILVQVLQLHELLFHLISERHSHRPVDVEGVDDDDLLYDIHFITGPNDSVPIMASAKHVAAAHHDHYII